MTTFRRWLLAPSILAALACAPGCASEEESTAEPEESALSRSDPNGTMPTADPAVRILIGYNGVLDSAENECVERGETPANIGNPESDFYLTYVNSREELAKQLDISANASVKIPKADLGASGQIMRSYKRSATTTSFLVRAVRKYTVSVSGGVRLKQEFADLLTAGNKDKFLAQCGASYVNSVTYEAQVLGLLQFDTKTEEDAKKVKGELMGNLSAPVKRLASASADVKAAAETTASRTNATMNLTVKTSGFLVPGDLGVEGIQGNPFEKIDKLRTAMAAAFDQDVAKDRAGYWGNNGRSARPTLVALKSYGGVSGAPDFRYEQLGDQLTGVERFLDDVSAPIVRIQGVYADEIDRFFNDTAEQFRYNSVASPQLRTSLLTPTAQSWQEKFRDDPARPGSLVQPLTRAIEDCINPAGNGDYSRCAMNASTEAAKKAAEDGLKAYTGTARIVRMSVSQPKTSVMSYWNAEKTCADAGLRLPKLDEVRHLGPAITALATRSPLLQDRVGEVWLSAGTINGKACAKPYAKNNEGQGTVACEEAAGEQLPSYLDRATVCVPKGGPIGALPTP